ncbi:MAG: DUF2783 domain-containing protein [Roseitalea porphyridii]|uniref:DUF2783 domain-containing protein n=1 Tax=Roseitalea porphyridii TaxID=1852022 RepID=UPI0032EF3289
MAPLNTRPNLTDPDSFYSELLLAHEGLTDEASAALNARLILILANHIGDREALGQALAAARQSGSASDTGDAT